MSHTYTVPGIPCLSPQFRAEFECGCPGVSELRKGYRGAAGRSNKVGVPEFSEVGVPEFPVSRSCQGGGCPGVCARSAFKQGGCPGVRHRGAAERSSNVGVPAFPPGVMLTPSMESGLIEIYLGGGRRSSKVQAKWVSQMASCRTPSVESDLPKGYRAAAERLSDVGVPAFPEKVGVPELRCKLERRDMHAGHSARRRGTRGYRRGRRGWSAVASCEDSFRGI